MKAKVTVEADDPIARIDPNLYGHFIEHLGSCIYEGIWVGEGSAIANEGGIRSDVVEALRRIKTPVVRWPGGCFADDYHWQDGIGPRDGRPARVNSHWGRVLEPNHFGTHEFMDFCSKIGAQPYVCGNVGSGTVREMRDWLEYMNFEGESSLAKLRGENGHPSPFNVRYFGVGNENWGCGGSMTPEYYADLMRRHATYLFFGDPLKRIACGPGGDNPEWTTRFFRELQGGDPTLSRMGLIQGYAIHYYCGTAGNATEYSEVQWYELLERARRIEPILLKHRAIMDGFDPHRDIGLVIDEWGTWHPPMEGTNPRFLKQQNTIRDALVAALSLDIFNRHADKVVMANIAQMINVLQSMILTNGREMLLTPTFHVYEMYAPHQGSDSVKCRIGTDEISLDGPGGGSIPVVAGSSSRSGEELVLSLVNSHVSEAVAVEVDIRGAGTAEMRSWRILAADDIHGHNTFEDPEAVKPVDMQVTDEVVLPPASVNVLTYGV